MKKPSKHTIVLITCSLIAAWFCTACGTVRGFGRDVEKVGGGIEKSAH